jgi:type 1 glutamine amidotransferase
MEKKALIVQGGWPGHHPVEVAEIFRGILTEEGFEVEVSDTLDAFLDLKKLLGLRLIIPIQTMVKGTVERNGFPRELDQLLNVIGAVESGVALAGCHGGMCDAFRESTKWQFMTGGQWVAHPQVKGSHPTYTVNIRRGSSPIVEGLEDFSVCSEQYYMHVDPVNEVLATTRFPVVGGPHAANGFVDVPVVWTRRWGKGRVFYCSLGHDDRVIRETPEVMTIMRRGFLWATGHYEVRETSQRSL